MDVRAGSFKKEEMLVYEVSECKTKYWSGRKIRHPYKTWHYINVRPQNCLIEKILDKCFKPINKGVGFTLDVLIKDRYKKFTDKVWNRLCFHLATIFLKLRGFFYYYSDGRWYISRMNKRRGEIGWIMI